MKYYELFILIFNTRFVFNFATSILVTDVGDGVPFFTF